MPSFNIKVSIGNLTVSVIISDSSCSLYSGDSPVHTHHSYEFQYIKSGRLEFDINREKILSEPGKIYLISPYTYHSVHKRSDSLRKLSLILKLSENKNSISGNDEYSYYSKVYANASDIEIIDSCSHYCDDLFECMEVFVNTGRLDREMFEALILVIFKKMAEAISGEYMEIPGCSKDDLFVESADAIRAMDAENYIEDNYQNDIGVGDLAGYLHLSVRQTNRFLREYMDISFSDFLRHYRIEIAKKLLEIPDKSIGEVAAEVGYKSYNGFFDAFRCVTGKKPSEYMRGDGEIQ